MHDEDHSHAHGDDCGHETVVHDDHVDYVHDGHRHAVHDAHDAHDAHDDEHCARPPRRPEVDHRPVDLSSSPAVPSLF